MKIEGAEFCGHCTDTFDFKVDENVWIVNCKTCGRPTILCDKCHSMGLDDNCAKCKHSIECKKLEKEWMKKEIGKIYFVDKSLYIIPSCDIEDGWYKVLKFNKDGAYVLENIENKNKITTYGEVIDYDKKFEN